MSSLKDFLVERNRFGAVLSSNFLCCLCTMPNNLAVTSTSSPSPEDVQKERLESKYSHIYCWGEIFRKEMHLSILEQ